MTMDEVNMLDQPAFVKRVGWVFEHSPWVAERAWAFRPFADASALQRLMTVAMRSANGAEQLALLQAHPDLGARARMSEASVNEQAGVGLNHLNQDEFDQLQRLNSEYKQKFGFPFLYAVKGSDKHGILAALERRLTNNQDDEFQEALTQVTRIAGFRIEELINGTIS